LSIVWKFIFLPSQLEALNFFEWLNLPGCECLLYLIYQW
jgi:hypothetical protein